jgi:hypothetical protein
VTNLQYEDQQNKPVPYPEVRRALPGLNSGTPSAISHAGGAGAPRHVPHGVELVPLGVYLIPLGYPTAVRAQGGTGTRGAPRRLAKPVAEDELRSPTRPGQAGKRRPGG